MRKLTDNKKIILLGATLFGVLVSLLPNQVYAMDWTNAILGTLSGDFLLGTLIAALSHVLLVLAGWWVSLTAGLLDVSISATLNMADLVNNTPSIGIMWRSIRDLSNIALIGVMLFASIRTILGLTGKDLSNTIKNVIICGLFINFSLFATRVMIDGSNLVALTFYDAIKPYDDYSISDTIMQKLKLQSFFSVTAIGSGVVNSLAGNESFTTKALITGMGAVTVMTMIGFLFLGAAITMVYRLVVLLLCMAFSPLYFIALVLPQTADARKQLEDTFYKQLFAGPTMLMVLYVGLKIVDSMSFGQNTQFANIFQGNGAVNKTVSDFANFAIGGPGTIAAFFNYALIIIVLGAALGVSQKSGGYGGAMANKWFEGFSKWGQGKIKGAMTGVYRQTYSRGFSKLAESEGLKDFTSKMPLLGNLALSNLKKYAKPYEEGVKKKAEEKAKIIEDLGYDKGRVKEALGRKVDQQAIVDEAHKNFTDARVTYKQKTQKKDSAEKALREAEERLAIAVSSGNQDRIREATLIREKRHREGFDAMGEYESSQALYNATKANHMEAEAALDKIDSEVIAIKNERTRNAEKAYGRTFFTRGEGKTTDKINDFLLNFTPSERKAAKELAKKLAKVEYDERKEAIADLKKSIDELEKKAKTKDGISADDANELTDLRAKMAELVKKQREADIKNG
jgi:hypothetical protein